MSRHAGREVSRARVGAAGIASHRGLSAGRKQALWQFCAVSDIAAASCAADLGHFFLLHSSMGRLLVAELRDDGDHAELRERVAVLEEALSDRATPSGRLPGAATADWPATLGAAERSRSKTPAPRWSPSRWREAPPPWTPSPSEGPRLASASHASRIRPLRQAPPAWRRRRALRSCPRLGVRELARAQPVLLALAVMSCDGAFSLSSRESRGPRSPRPPPEICSSSRA